MREVIPLTGGLRSLSPGVELLQQHGLSASGSELYLSKQQRAESDSNAQDPEPPSGKTLADLPHELLVDIMGWLRFSDLKTCRLVCHSFSKCASEKVRACVVKSSPVAQNLVQASLAYPRLQALMVSGDVHIQSSAAVEEPLLHEGGFDMQQACAVHDSATAEAFSKLGMLNVLVLQYVVVSDQTLLSMASCLSRLVELRLESLPFITDEGMWHVGLLGNLTSLSLVHVPVTNKGLALLADDASPICNSLEALTLNGVKISDSGLIPISINMVKLRRLELSHIDDLSNTTLRHLMASASLISLRLAHLPCITDAGMAMLTESPALAAVELCGLLQVTHTGVLAVGHNERIRVLVLAYMPKVKAHAISSLAERLDLDLRVFGMRMHW